MLVNELCEYQNARCNDKNKNKAVYMFRTVLPSIIRSLRLYIQHHTIQVLWLLASKQQQNLYDTYLILYVQS